MDVEFVQAFEVAVEEVVSFDGHPGWALVEDAAMGAGYVTLRLCDLQDGTRSVHDVDQDIAVRRGDRTAVHHRDEFVGMTLPEAEAWAAAIGWEIRDRSKSGFYTDDWHSNRINVWPNEAGRVVRAEMF